MKKDKKLIIFGLGKMAQLAHFYFTRDSNYEVVAFTLDQDYIKEKTYLGLPIVSFENVENVFDSSKFEMFIAIGYKKLNSLRIKKYNDAKSKGYKLATYVCSKLTSWGDYSIGDNCFVLENQVIQPFVKIGNNVIIWSGNHFGHDVEVGDHTYISSHIVFSGNVKIGKSSFIGVNATIRDGVVVGDECIIGAGSLLNNNVKDKSVLVAEATKVYPLNSEMFEKMMEISKK